MELDKEKRKAKFLSRFAHCLLAFSGIVLVLSTLEIEKKIVLLWFPVIVWGTLHESSATIRKLVTVIEGLRSQSDDSDPLQLRGPEISLDNLRWQAGMSLLSAMVALLLAAGVTSFVLLLEEPMGAEENYLFSSLMALFLISFLSKILERTSIRGFLAEIERLRSQPNGEQILNQIVITDLDTWKHQCPMCGRSYGWLDRLTQPAMCKRCWQSGDRGSMRRATKRD